MKEITPSARIIFPSTPEVAIEMQKACEYAGRNCYDSFARMNETSFQKLLHGLIVRGHESVQEHSVMVAEIKTDRAVMYELTRHRHSSFSIRSQRFVDESQDGNISFIKPVFGKYEGDLKQIATNYWRDDCLDCERRYFRMREAGATSEDARKCLNNSVATNIVMSGNLRQWRQVFKLRTAPNVYPECRVVMKELLEKSKVMFPGIFDDIDSDEGV